ncbi:MAG: hypothetical protein GEV09_04395 [Pseudonocardiaceae bacterium]|nr:hypothetical protein [Pseudonocardiaceae bacterium]
MIAARTPTSRPSRTAPLALPVQVDCAVKRGGPVAVTRDHALELARQLLSSQFGEDLKTAGGDAVVIQFDLVGDYTSGWSVPFNTRIYLDGGPPPTGVIPSVIIVPKDGETAPHFAPTALPVAEYMRWVHDGEMQWSRLPEDFVTYFAKVSDRHPRSNPRGIARRRMVNGHLIDEAFTRNLRWEPTDYFQRYRLGHNDVDHVKITSAEAKALIQRVTEEIRG